MTTTLYLVICVYSFFLICSSYATIIELNLRTNWTLENANKSIQISNLSIPINVHHALEDNKLIGNPLDGYNDMLYRWIPYEPQWTYRKYFYVNQTLWQFVNNDGVIVQFEFYSLDTIVSVYLNDQFILFAQNQFLKYTVLDFKQQLLSGMNKLELQFKSPIIYANEISMAYPYRVPPVCTEPVQNGECHVNFLRKQACSFSWDWGPAYAPSGINDEIKFKVYDSFDYELSINTYPQVPYQLVVWFISVAINITTDIPEMMLDVEISIPEKNLYYNAQTYVYPYTRMHVFNVTVNAQALGVDLWYPSGFGNQTLYNLNVNCTAAGNSIVKSRNIAFRTVQLIQRPVLQTADQGLTFFFEINNQPTFLKGSNWIPMDVFQDRLNLTYLVWLMQSVKEANMNVLRVWGGGEYETNEFYDIADQLGIMIWQDFMFACATYPTNAEFLDNVAREVEYQLWRLSHHPSIIVWSGNNENEAAVATNWYGTDIDKPLYYNDYRELYINVIRSKVLQFDQSPQPRPFISSSPTNGQETENENWIATNPYDLRFGDVHFYNYFVDGWDPSVYPYSRFTSEFGFQSIPSYSTLETVFNVSTDMSLFSDMMNHRQHHLGGIRQLLNQLTMHFQYPGNDSSSFKQVIHLTQANQAMSYKTAAEFHRRNRDFLNKTSGLGNCYGFMYWQLNDLWQAPTWSTIEYGGKWKMAHYYIKKSYAALIISPNLNTQKNALEINILTDMLIQNTINDSVVLQVFKYTNGFNAVYKQNINFQISSFESSMIAGLDLAALESKTGCSRTSSQSNCLLTFTFASQNPDLRDGENFLFYNNRFRQVIGAVSVVSVQKVDAYTFSVQIAATQISLFVWLDVENANITGYFSDNGFHLTEPTRNVTYHTINNGIDESSFKQYLSVLSILPF